MVSLTSPAAGPNMAGNQTQGGNAQSQSAGGKGGATPFVRASAQHTEPTGYDVSTLMSASVQTLPDIQVPAYGFLRSIILVVTTTGSAGTSVFGPDAPWNALQNIVLQEPNGAQIANFPSGYDLYLANKFGGYQSSNDPRLSANYITTPAGGAFSFALRIPVEIDLRSGLGALPNQNSGALFRVKLNLASTSTSPAGTALYTTVPPTTLPTVRVRAYAEEWDQPEASTNGVANQTVPPALNTTQYWSRQDFPINAGQSNIRLTRMGNYLRNIVFVLRDATTAARLAQDANFPDPATIYYDTRPLDTVSRAVWLDRLENRYGYGGYVQGNTITTGAALAGDTGGGREYSVWPFDFCHEFDGGVGFENRDLWLPTYSSTRFEIGGTWGGASTLSVLTNDVTIAGNVWS
jgi:hypothetical protein